MEKKRKAEEKMERRNARKSSSDVDDAKDADRDVVDET